MAKEAEYRSFATSCLEIATTTCDTVNKTRLLATAEERLDLADRVSQLAKRPPCKIAAHPLVKDAAPIRRSGDGIVSPQLPGPSVKFTDHASHVATATEAVCS